MSPAARPPSVAVSPQDFLFAVAGTVVLAFLATGLARRESGLGGAEADFMGALYLAAIALLAALLAAFRGWGGPADVLVAGTCGGALVAMASASLQSAGVRASGLFGDRGLRWTLVTAAVALSAFGWGGAVGDSGAAAGPGSPAPWVGISVAVACAGAVLAAAVSASRARARPIVRVQLLGGAAALAVGMAAVALGAVATGSAAGMVGAGFVYSAARGPKRVAKAAERKPTEPKPTEARRAAGPAARARNDPGVKVRVPKGSASRVTRFRDDGLPPGR